jgi:sRNA-binding regulator protein Hfq
MVNTQLLKDNLLNTQLLKDNLLNIYLLDKQLLNAQVTEHSYWIYMLMKKQATKHTT